MEESNNASRIDKIRMAHKMESQEKLIKMLNDSLKTIIDAKAALTQQLDKVEAALKTKQRCIIEQQKKMMQLEINLRATEKSKEEL